MRRLTLALAMVLIPAMVWAAGTVTVSNQNQNPNDQAYVVTFEWTSDGTEAADATAYFPYGVYIAKVVTNPDDSAAPTDDYDITLTDVDGYDVMGGTLADRDETNSESVVPRVLNDGTNEIFGGALVIGSLTLNVSNAGASKEGVVRVYVVRAY